MREVSTDEITKNIKEMCIEANYILSDDVKNKIINSAAVENSEIGKKILSQLEENMEIAEREQIPICQDTGMAVVFIKVGQEVHITGGNLEDAINQGVREGYTEGYLRKSVVKDPLIRENTKDRRMRPQRSHFRRKQSRWPWDWRPQYWYRAPSSVLTLWTAPAASSFSSWR